MPFVKRNENGEIVAVSQERSRDNQEEINSNDASLNSFILNITQKQSVMTESDLSLVRVVEDLVDLLVKKNYILFTELPQKAQEKMKNRQALRGEINNKLDLLSDDDDSFNM